MAYISEKMVKKGFAALLCIALPTCHRAANKTFSDEKKFEKLVEFIKKELRELNFLGFAIYDGDDMDKLNKNIKYITGGKERDMVTQAINNRSCLKEIVSVSITKWEFSYGKSLSWKNYERAYKDKKKTGSLLLNVALRAFQARSVARLIFDKLSKTKQEKSAYKRYDNYKNLSKQTKKIFKSMVSVFLTYNAKAIKPSSDGFYKFLCVPQKGKDMLTYTAIYGKFFIKFFDKKNFPGGLSTKETAAAARLRYFCPAQADKGSAFSNIPLESNPKSKLSVEEGRSLYLIYMRKAYEAKQIKDARNKTSIVPEKSQKVAVVLVLAVGILYHIMTSRGYLKDNKKARAASN